MGIKSKLNIAQASIGKHLALLSSQAHLAYLEFQMLQIASIQNNLTNLGLSTIKIDKERREEYENKEQEQVLREQQHHQQQLRVTTITRDKANKQTAVNCSQFRSLSPSSSSPSPFHRSPA